MMEDGSKFNPEERYNAELFMFLHTTADMAKRYAEFLIFNFTEFKNQISELYELKTKGENIEFSPQLKALKKVIDKRNRK